MIFWLFIKKPLTILFSKKKSTFFYIFWKVFQGSIIGAVIITRNLRSIFWFMPTYFEYFPSINVPIRNNSFFSEIWKFFCAIWKCFSVIIVCCNEIWSGVYVKIVFFSEQWSGVCAKIVFFSEQWSSVCEI